MRHDQRKTDKRVLSAHSDRDDRIHRHLTQNAQTLSIRGRNGMDPVDLFRREAPPVRLAGASGVVTADFNRDGVADLAVITPGEELLVLLGARSGLYRRAFCYALGAAAHGLYATDLDGDGKLDLAVAHGDGDGFKTFRGKGDGTFAPTGAVVEAHPTTWSLTPREHEVARLAGGGYTCAEIAGKLGISRRTAETHVNAIRSKLELKHKRELVYLAGTAANRRGGSDSPNHPKTLAEAGH